MYTRAASRALGANIRGILYRSAGHSARFAAFLVNLIGRWCCESVKRLTGKLSLHIGLLLCLTPLMEADILVSRLVLAHVSS